MAAMSEFQKQLKMMPGQALIMIIWGQVKIKCKSGLQAEIQDKQEKREKAAILDFRRQTKIIPG